MVEYDSLSLNVHISKKIFSRTGEISQIIVFVNKFTIEDIRIGF